MTQQSRFSQSVEQIVAEFFETGQEDQVHTLHFEGAISTADKPAIEAALTHVEGVDKLHVDSERACVHVLFSGPIESLVDAVEKAGYEVATAH